MSDASPAAKKIREAIVGELHRQAETTGGLSVTESGDDVSVEGTIRLDDLVMVVLGSVAGGP